MNYADIPGLITIDPKNTIGMSLNWQIGDRATSVEALEAAFAAYGLDPGRLPPATTGFSVFGFYGKANKSRLYRPLPVGRREFVGAAIVHNTAERHMMSYSYSVLFGGGVAESKLVPIGSLTYDRHSGVCNWQFTFDEQQPDELVSRYIARGVSSYEGTGVVAADLAFFAAHCAHVVADIAVYVDAPHYSPAAMRVLLHRLLASAGCYLLTPRGGLWLAPRHDTEDLGPLGIANRITQAYEAVSHDTCFFRMTLPRDPHTIATAAHAIHTGLRRRVTDIIDKIDEIPVMTRYQQHTARVEVLAEVEKEAGFYRETLGLSTDEIDSLIANARDIIRLHSVEFDARRLAEQIAAKAALAKRRPPRRGSVRSITAAKVTTIRKWVSDGGVVHNGVELVVEKDPTLGYLYAIVVNDNVRLSGSATTKRAVVDALRKAKT